MGILLWMAWLAAFYAVWAFLVFGLGNWQTVKEHWPMALAMALGSYAAGSTPMGGGTVGFPVLVLLFDTPASLGRDFSFAVQAIGMVSASFFLFARRQPLAGAMLKGAMLGSLLGTPLGIQFVAPLVPELWIKLAFAVVWGSFGILHLYRLREITGHSGSGDLQRRRDFRIGLALGIGAGASAVAITGVGIDMVIYAALVLLCRVDLKVAIPTSVVIMAFNSVVGVVVKSVSGAWHPEVFGNWLAAAPVVILGAPLGVFIVALIDRKLTLLIVALLCVGQLVWTCFAERVALGTLGLLATMLAVGICLLIFEWLRNLGGRFAGADLSQAGGTLVSSGVSGPLAVAG